MIWYQESSKTGLNESKHHADKRCNKASNAKCALNIMLLDSPDKSKHTPKQHDRDDDEDPYSLRKKSLRQLYTPSNAIVQLASLFGDAVVCYFFILILMWMFEQVH